MTIVQEVKKIIPSKLDDKAKAVYNRLKEETNNFDIEFLVVYTDLEKAVEQFVDVVKKKYPDAIRVVRKKEKPTPPPTPEPETDDKEVLEVIRDYRISESQAKRLVQLRRDASESKKESIDKMLDTLKKSEFYNARYTSKQNIDKNRTRDIKKDSNRGSLTAKDELNMTGKRYKRISKAGHKNQYGTTEGGKVYYEYRANRRDIDHKIELAQGGLIGKEVEFLRYGEPMTGRVYEDLGNDRFAVESTKGIHSVDKENIVKVIEPKKGRFFGLFKKGGRIDLFEDYENIPPNIQEILDFYEEDFQDGRYDGLSKALKEVEANGYTFEYYLDGEAYGLRPINVPLNHIKGYEDEDFARGGIASKNIFDLEYGDVFKIKKAGHTASNMTFVYVDLDDKYNVSIKARPFPIGSNKRNEFVYITDIQDGDIQILSEEEVGKIYLNYNIDKNKFVKGGGVGKFKYERGQKFQDQYGEIILLDKYSDGLWEARRWSGMRHVGDVVISEKDLDLIRTKKMAKGDVIKGGVEIPKADKMFHLPFELAVYVPSTTNVSDSISTTEMRKRVKETETYLAETFGGFTSSEKIGGYLSSKSTIVTEKVVPVTAFCSMEDFRKNKNKLINKLSVWAKAWGQEAIGFEFEGDLYYVPQKFKKGGTLKATYIPKDNIAQITTIFGQKIKGKDIIDGAYTKRQDIRNEPKIDRFMFEDEMYEYKKGGFVSKAELVWKKLSSAEKMNFLIENFTPQITPTSQQILVDKAYNFLPKEVKITLASKYADVEEYAKGGWVLYDEDSQEAIRTYKTESEARENLYEYEGNANIVKKSIWDKTYEPKVDRFMFEEEMYEYKKGGRVSENVYYDMLGAVPPLYISELDGVKQSGNTTFAVGEAYDYMNTPNGFKSVYQAFSQKGKFYYNEGLIYFTERGVAKSIME